MSAINLIVFPVTDLEKATKLYTTLLDVAPYVSSPYYVGFRDGDQEIGLDPNGHKKLPARSPTATCRTCAPPSST